eukprot:1470352-Ditylum_brightwellii.AAC.1
MEHVSSDEDNCFATLDNNLLDNEVEKNVLLQLSEMTVQMDDEAKEMLKHGQTEKRRKKYSLQ